MQCCSVKVDIVYIFYRLHESTCLHKVEAVGGSGRVMVFGMDPSNCFILQSHLWCSIQTWDQVNENLLKTVTL